MEAQNTSVLGDIRQRLINYRAATQRDTTELYKPESEPQDPEDAMLDAYMQKEFTIPAIPEKFAGLINIMPDMKPISYEFPDDKLMGQPGIEMEKADPDALCELGRIVIPMLANGFTKQGAAALFPLAYNMKTPGSKFMEDLLTMPEKLLSVRDRKYTDFSNRRPPGPNRNVQMAGVTDPTRESAVYSYIAATTLRLFTKSADNYLKAWENIVEGFSKFYNARVDIQLPSPDKTAVKGLADWFAIEPVAKQSLYRILYMANSAEQNMGFKKFTFEMHLANTGMHIVRLFMDLAQRLNCSPALLLTMIDTPRFEPQVKSLIQILKLADNNDGNHACGMWKYGRVFDETFMADIQTRRCPKLVYVLASALKSVAPETYQNVTNIVQLEDVSDASKKRCELVALQLLKTVRSSMKGETTTKN